MGLCLHVQEGHRGLTKTLIMSQLSAAACSCLRMIIREAILDRLNIRD